MKDLLKTQFEQLWRMLSAIVDDYDERSWKDMGHGLTRPPRLSFHIIQSIKYYMDDRTDIALPDGRAMPHDRKMADGDAIISRDDIAYMISSIKGTVDAWIAKVDLREKNERCAWTGKDMESVVLFMIRHSYFHLGELNALLNEYREGGAADHFAKNIY